MSYKPKYPCVVCGTPAADGHTDDCIYAQKSELLNDLESVTTLALAGLRTDGSHHKQWYLEEILRVAGGITDTSGELLEKGIAP